MNVKIQSVKFDADKKLLDFIEAKLTKFSRFSDKITSSDVTLKLDKDNDVGNKVVVIEVHLPGDVLVAERKSKSFEESTDECIDALKKQLDKYKEKH
ncbi:MAG: ribosome-associated translation inhibitor RaiA [Rikenellaceae bacterium]